jgi:hypothetical protein
MLQIERAFRLFDRPDRHAMGVDYRGLQTGVAQQGLNYADVVIIQVIRLKVED